MAHKAMSALGKRSTVQLPALGFGGAGVMLGGAGTVASPKLAEDGDRVGIGFRLPTDLEARANLESQWSAGVRYFDTAPCATPPRPSPAEPPRPSFSPFPLLPLPSFSRAC